jgi:hypothetical protein
VAAIKQREAQPSHSPCHPAQDSGNEARLPAHLNRNRYCFQAHLPGSPNPAILAVVLLASGVFLYLHLFAWPAIPRVAIGDQSIYLHSASRLYEGQFIYKDYDQFTFPAADFLYLFFFRLFGVKAWIPQVMLLIVGVVSVGLGVAIASKVLRGPAAYLPALLYLTLPYASYPDATHHLYNVLAATAALAVVVERRSPLRIALAGFFWGIAASFTQSLILGALGFAFFLLWEHRQESASWSGIFKAQIWMWVPYVAVLFAFIGYVTWKAGLHPFLYYTVLFVLKYVPSYKIGGWSTYLRGWPSVHRWTNWPDLPAWPLIHGLVPLIYIAFFLRYWDRIRLESSENRNCLVLINVVGASLFLTIASAPAWNRLYTVSMPALIVLVWIVRSQNTPARLLRTSLWCLALALAVVRPTVMQARWRGILTLPTGSTAFLDRGLYEETMWLMERTHPGDYFFGDQLLCFDLRLRNPARVAYVTPFAFTTQKEVADVVQSLDAHQVRFVSWYPGLDDPSAVVGNHLSPLRTYLAEHYRIAQRFANGHVIWERKS